MIKCVDGNECDVLVADILHYTPSTQQKDITVLTVVSIKNVMFIKMSFVL